MKKNKVMIMIVLTLLLFNTSCDLHNTSSPFKNANMQKGPNELIADSTNVQTLTSQKAGVGVLYKLSYDQITVELSPDDLAGAKNEKRAGEALSLENYEHVKRTVTIDKQGYINITTEWLNGDSNINIPAEVYQRTEHLRPAPEHGYKPVAKSEIANGFIRFYASDGEILNEFVVDKSQFRIDSDRFLETLSQSRSPRDINARVEQAMLGLKQQSSIVKRLDNRYAEISANVRGTADAIQRKQVVDLALGVVIRSEDKGPHGKVLNREFMNYAQTDNLPVLKHSISEYYGERNDSWGITSRKIVNRNNIEIFTN